MNIRLYLWQRGTAMLLVPMILVHLAVIFYATSQNLTADAILSRTRGSVTWGLFYGIFVLLAAIHASIGVRNILQEWGRLRDRTAGQLAVLFGVLLLVLGLRAVAAVVMP
ncbi:succinate dehydrogenase [Acidiphilium multivorum]|uniref:succinate dehydrogenase n=1 Tax=Acidiphilium multivorum TaxID=62140 RepID=UPI001F4C054F|nr:succinate dehydrogenase [Acidiphilium multivorum]UNC13946.1 succinate dehydrogenase [Acidiphilium multivorum]